MEEFANRLSAARAARGLTQAQLAERLDLSFQAVSLWERGEAYPDIQRLPKLAELLQVSTDYLLLGKTRTELPQELRPMSQRLFNEERMYTYVKTYAAAQGLTQAVGILPYVREKHKDQFRDGEERVPYIYHPLLVTCQALAMSLLDDELISAALLHDVCEDCGVLPEELPVNEETRQIVRLLTKPKDENDAAMEGYYRDIAENGKATVIKLIDRCCNISGMAAGFSREKLVEYMAKTKRWIYPLFDVIKYKHPQYSNQGFLIKYQISGIIDALCWTL